MIGLADCNNFFVSCERVFRPDLRDRPVVVLSSNDGCAVALSNEAKALGIKRGDPYFQFKPVADKNDVVVMSGNHRLYGDMSRRVMDTLRRLVPGSDIEVYSVDEAFVHIPPVVGDYADYGRYLVRSVMRHTGIPISLGIAPTKTLAKVAARFAKKFKGYEGSCLIDTEEKRQRALELTDIGDVWGIGRRHRLRLESCGLTTAADLSRLTAEQVGHLFSIVGERTWRELNGEPCIGRDDNAPGRKTITSSRTFATDLTEFESLRQAVCSFATIAGRKLRRDHGFAAELEVWVCTNRFHDYAPQYFNSAAVVLSEPADDTPTLAAAATAALKAVFRSGYGYKRAGMTITRIEPAKAVQVSLFADVADIERRHRLMQVMDEINSSPMAPDRVHIASSGPGLDPLLRRDHASRLYTTRLSDVIEVKGLK